MTETVIEDRNEYTHIIKNMNPGIVVFKFTAEWCGPCKRVKKLVDDLIKDLPSDKARCLYIDVDDSFDIYAYLKQKKMVKGVPTLLCYPIESLDIEHLYVPKHSYSGSNEAKIREFFNMCKKECENCN